MRTLAVLLLLGALVLLSPEGRTEEKAAPAVLKTLEEALEEVIEACEPAVACILVSRSDEYRHFKGAMPPNPAAGQLGKFDGEAARRSVPRKDKDKDDDLLKLIQSIDLDAPDHTPESYGSGIVLDASGLILTNAHVVRNAKKVYVRLPGGKGSYADIHASDPRSDLAVLRLLDPLPGLKPLKLGQQDRYRKGQMVLLLANPFAAGFRDGSPTASWGMIANLRRRSPGLRSELDRDRRTTLHHYGTLLQLDTRITLGSSGGAVLNLKGELIGITTALAALTGIETPGGFAVPLDSGLRRVVEVLKRGEEVEYGFLGVSFQAGNERKKDVVIEKVVTGSPADQAGLKTGDRILSINGSPVNDIDDLFLLLGTSLASSQARIEVQNGFGPRHTVSARLAKFHVPGPIIAAHRPPARFGLRVDYNSILSQRPFPPPWPHEGVIIREVISNTPADRARLQVDKLITRVNNSRVTTPAEFYEAMAKAGRSVEIAVLNSEGREERVTLEGLNSTMRYAICNETFEGWDHEQVCRVVAGLGYQGLEMAPFTLAPRITDVSAAQRRRLRAQAESHGVQIIGLHWLLAKTHGLQITHPEAGVRQDTANYLVELARCCRDLGGTLMVFGSPGQRRIPLGATTEEAADLAVDTFQRAKNGIVDAGVKLCLEPLSPPEADFINTADEVNLILDRLASPHFVLHLDVKAMSTEKSPTPDLIRKHAARMGHFHANDPNLRGPGFGKTDFVPIFQALKDVNYRGWVSVEVFDYSPDPETLARESMRYMKECESKLR